MELALSVEVGDKEASGLVCFGDLGHELDVERACEMLHILTQVKDWSGNLDLVFPVVISPLLLELQLAAVSRHEGIDEVDLDLVDVDDVGDVATRAIKGKVPIDRSIVRRANLKGCLDDLGGTCLQSKRDRLLNDLQVALGKQFTVDVLNRLLGAVDQDDLEEDVVVVHFGDSFSVDRVRVPCQLVDLLLVFALQLAHEVGGVDAASAKLFRDVKVSTSSALGLKLAELDALIWLRHSHVLHLRLGTTFAV